MIRVLAVCLGNICRSPAAEGVLLAHLRRRGLEDVVAVDSAGTAAYHVGEPADARMMQAAERRGYALPSVGRAVRDEDFGEFDLILAMDRQNLADLNQRGTGDVRLLGEFVPGDEVPEVPDPYYGGDAGFERVLDLIESAMPALLDELAARAETDA
jgi:protein-tyrosine phosphatase